MPSITATPGHPDSAGKVTTECPTGCRVTVTAYTDGLTKTVPGAELELKLTSGASAKATADDRAVVTFVIADLSGTEGFTITATYPGSKTPRVNQIAQQAEAAALLTANAQCAPMPVLKMYLDVDRDGKVDGKPADNAHWTWGKAGKGAVLLVNKRDDYEMGDTVVERTEVAFRWAPKKDPGDQWTCKLELEPNKHLRMFVGPRIGDAELPLDGGPDLKAGAIQRADDGSFKVWLEATEFAQEGWPAEVKLTFSHDPTGGGSAAHQQTAVVRIAPWIMTSDLDGTKELYILKFAASKGFIVNGLPISNDGLLGEVQGIAGEVLKPYSGNLSGKSRYLRDAMRFGAQTGPGDDNHYPVLLRGNNSTTQYKVPQQQELGRAANKVAYMELGQTGKTDLMTGGNTMVSPPVKGYPWGRIICGDNGSGAYNEQHGVFEPWKPFLEAQEVQKPLYVDTLWLEVGHSDEIISFVPNVKGSGFKVLLASPRKAYEILTDLELKRVPLIRIKAERSGEYHKTINTWRSSFDEEHKRSIGDPMNSVAADGSVIIDYSDEAFSGPELSRGNGMLLFHRFLSGRCVQRWVDKFLLDDPFLKVAAVAHKPEDKQALDQARDANIKALIQQEIEKKNFKHDRWVAIEATAQTSWSTDQQQMVKILITDTIRRLAKAYQADDGPEADEHEQSRRARTVSLLYLMPTLTGRHDAWAPDEDKARDWMARAHDDLLKRFPASRFAHPEGFLKRCKAMWEALPEIEASLPDPTQAAPHAPDDVSIRQALVTKMGQRFGRDLSQVETSELINNLHRQIKLDKIRASLLAELGIKDSDVIDVPILYNHKQGRALTADMVNLVQLNKPADAKKSSSSGCVCIVPKPHGPIWGGEDLFQKEMKEQLKKIGVTAHFVDEWYEYHADDGEIHCGSNQLPVTERQNWWDHKPPGQ